MDLYLSQLKDIILGQEFLTWLWYKSETSSGSFKTANGEEFNLYIEQKISVQGGEGDNVETATVSGAMSELKEAKIGLLNGKKVTKALVRIENEIDSWQANIKADDFTFTSLKTPKIEAGNDEGDDPDAKFLEKIFLIERYLYYIDTVFQIFLTLRFSPDWKEEVKSFRDWLQEN